MRENSIDKDQPPMFLLVESDVCLEDGKAFKTELKDYDHFESDVINASKAQCQEWAQKNWKGITYSSREDIAIADERTARDGTLLMSTWCQSDIPFEDWGPLPPKVETWYGFRVHHRAACEFSIAIHWAPIEEAYPIYYARPEKYNNDAGVFEVLKVNSRLKGEVENHNPIWSSGP
ncbi:uncharacterized protein N7484_009036 [Penicillium longicatenatum]|uniref:uncharacterized protein n=1 Tax=Penicillium longicatenatum TaxID=1561947 RepID=UPI0025477CA0|nr:uncharacterized protein N7484_009036 [Penicillium longicatenatum]KAJ5635723.1 hypothetical protein N7484_009036 [Penicillium longicatenatum]